MTPFKSFGFTGVAKQGKMFVVFRRSAPLYSGGSAVGKDYTMYTVYALYNKENAKTYIGQTENIERRLVQHNTHIFKGYTSRFSGEWMVIYTESVSTRSEALIREKQLKSGNGRAFVKTFIPA
jgi:putative endonuclease